MNGWVAFGLAALWAFLAALVALAHDPKVERGDFWGEGGVILRALYEGVAGGLFALFLLLFTVSCLALPFYLGVLAFQGETEWVVAAVSLPLGWVVAFFAGVFFLQLFLGEDW